MKKIIIGILVTMGCIGYFIYDARPDGLLHVYFLDVGQGDSILIRTPKGHNILIDGGPSNGVMSELKDVLPFFDTTLDYVLLTHPDRDHIEGLLSVLQRYPVKKVMVSGVYTKSGLLKSFLKIIQDKKIVYMLADQFSDIKFDDEVTLDILFPFISNIVYMEKANNYSLITKMIYGEHEILFTGDSEAPQENILLKANVDLAADILKVGHHGSKTSSQEKFLDAVQSEYAVISLQKGNSYGHPHASVINSLQKRHIKI